MRENSQILQLLETVAERIIGGYHLAAWFNIRALGGYKALKTLTLSIGGKNTEDLADARVALALLIYIWGVLDDDAEALKEAEHRLGEIALKGNYNEEIVDRATRLYNKVRRHNG